MVEKISKAGSMKGYSFKTWLARNKDTLKYLLMAVSGVATNMIIEDVKLKWIATIAVPVLIKLVIDAIDFYSSDVVL
jgi:hypothetical protein